MKSQCYCFFCFTQIFASPHITIKFIKIHDLNKPKFPFLSHQTLFILPLQFYCKFSAAGSCSSMSPHWLGLVAAIWLQSINGTNSNFPAYSSELKRILSISQLQLNNLAFASDAGKLLGWVSGVAAACLPLWLVLLIGSVLGAAGYGVQFLFLTNRITSLSYWQVFSLTVLAGNSICWINTVSYILAIRNFPLDRQIAVGISTSYVGLSAKIYTTVVEVAAGADAPAERAKTFLLLNSVLPLLVCVGAAPLTRNANVGKSRDLVAGFITLFAITVVTGCFSVATSLAPRVLPAAAVLVGIIVFLVVPLVTPAAEEIGEAVQQKCRIVVLVHDEESLKRGGLAGKERESLRNDGEEEMTPLLMVRRVEFWLYFMVYMFGATLGLVYLNNLGQIAESRGCLGISSLISLSSAFSFFGRLLPSLLDYFFSKSKCVVSRATAMGAMTAPMSGAFFLLVMSKRELALYISTAVVGVCSGAITSISVSATTELFGTTNFGVNHNILISNIPIGSFLFGGFAALLYKQGRGEGEENCVGHKCYQTTLFIWASFCVFGTLLAFALHVKANKLLAPK